MKDALTLLADVRACWQQHSAEADRALAAAKANAASCRRELEAVTDDLARLRLAAAEDLIETGASA